MQATVSKWGNSQGLRLPKEVITSLNINVGKKVSITIEDEKIILEPIKESEGKHNLTSLLAQVPDDYQPSEGFDDQQGIEAW